MPCEPHAEPLFYDKSPLLPHRPTALSIHKMHTVTRNRETLFGRFIFEHNPAYENAPGGMTAARSSSLEGGDILVLSPEVLAVGISQRTEGRFH